MLEVKKDNEAALSLYHKVGFEVVEEIPNFYVSGEAAFRRVFVPTLSQTRNCKSSDRPRQ